MKEIDIQNLLAREEILSQKEVEEVISAFEDDSNSNGRLVAIFLNAREYIQKHFFVVSYLSRLHFCAQRYILNIINAHPENQNLLTAIYYDEISYYLFINEPEKIVLYANRMIDVVNRDYTSYAKMLGHTIDAFLSLGMYEEVKPLVARLELYVSSHYMPPFVEYTLLANLIYAFAFLQDKQKYKFYLKKFTGLNRNCISQNIVYFTDLYILSCAAIMSHGDVEGVKVSFRDLIIQNSLTFKDKTHIIVNQSFLLLPLFERVWDSNKVEEMLSYIIPIIEHSVSIKEKIDYYHFIFDKMNVSKTKYSDLYEQYLTALKQYYLYSVELKKDEVKEEIIRSQIETIYRKQAGIDILSKLSNRFLYEGKLNEIRNHGVLPQPLSFVLADLNNLKITNDTKGHEAGDEMIIAISDLMKQVYSPHGDVYRVGGDEFIAIINIDGEKLQTLNDKLRSLISSWSGKLIDSFSISLGSASTNELPPKSKVEDLIKLMDDRMYEEKHLFHKTK